MSRAHRHFIELIELINVFDYKSLELIVERLRQAVAQDASIFIGGNGGSATIALHYATDWTKGVFEKNGKGLRTFPLSANPGLTSAISNDVNFESSLSFQLQTLGKEGDLVVLISSSGNSPNIIAAANKARTLGMSIIGISGFGHSKLVQLSDHSLTIDSTNTQLVEDMHAVIGHLIYLSLIEKKL